jgi:hypothetical protein
MAGYMHKEAADSAPAPKVNPYRIHKALAKRESGGEADPFFRHNAPKDVSSTAYAETGITATQAREFQRRKLFGDPNSPSMPWKYPMRDYLNRYVEQGEKFKHHGRNKGKVADYDPKYDYGGKGDMGNTPDDRAKYRQMSMYMIRDMYNRAGGDINKFLQAWRGVPESEAPEYYRSVRKSLGYAE